MKKTLLAFAFFCIYSGQAAAAGHDWTGGYVGLNLGSNQGDSRADVSLQDQWSTESAGFQADVVDAWSTSLDPSGTGFGVQAGYDFQFSNDWVLGFSVEYNDLNADDGRLTGQIPLPAAPSVTYQYGNSIEAQSSWGVRSRLGYAFDNSLLYFTLGWMSVDVDATAEIFSGSNGYSKLGVASETVNGMSFGIGWEYAFNDNWSLQMECQRSNLDDFNFTTAYRPGSTFVSPAYTEVFTQDLEVNSFRIGFNYRF